MSSQFAFQGSGTFSAEKTFDTIKYLASSTVTKFDTTGALELLFDVDTFNGFIGIVKDASNVNVTSTEYYDSLNDILLTDTLTLSAAQFVSGLNNKTSNVKSVGRLSTLYSDFAIYIASYFGLPPSSATTPYTSVGFETLFSGEYLFNPNNGVFGAQQFLDVATSGSIVTSDDVASDDAASDGSYLNNLNGGITLTDITKLLRFAVANNTFNNRNTFTGLTASDPADRKNYGVSDGFFDGDLLFIPDAGFQISLKLGLKTSTFKNDEGLVLSADTGSSQDASGNISTDTSTFSQKTTSTSSLIDRVVKVPLLIRLTNLKLPYISELSVFKDSDDYNVLSFKGLFEMVDISRYVANYDTPTVIASHVTPSISYDILGNAIYSYKDLPNDNIDYYYVVTPHNMDTGVKGHDSLIYTGIAEASGYARTISGSTGSTGSAGSTGSTGSTDSTDSTDSTGATGATGSTDSTDSTGATGATGSYQN
jgi:hypothetical protein